MILILFLMLTVAIATAGFGYKKASIIIFSLTIILSLYVFSQHLTTPVNIQL